MMDIQIIGRAILTLSLKAKTGLMIGGNDTGMAVGGIDKEIIRNALNGEPYIPGSSLRGKLRSQLEKAQGKQQNTSIGRGVSIHTCQTAKEYTACDVCRIFGIAADEKDSGEGRFARPARLIVRDLNLSDDSRREFDKLNLTPRYAELKTEAAIDRVTSAATPRTFERVPAGAVFGPTSLVFTFYRVDLTKDGKVVGTERDGAELFKSVLEAFLLLEDDYLGGSGSRGYGSIEVENVSLSYRKHGLGEPVPFGKEFSTLAQLHDEWSTLGKWLAEQSAD